MTARELVEKAKNLPAAPQASLRLVSLLGQPNASNEEVIQVIRCDGTLTARLLRVCNSPFFGLGEPVSSVDQAVLMLGHQQLLHVVLALAFGGALMRSLPSYAVVAQELWRHSLTTATAAEVLLANGLELETSPPAAFTAGLLHDIGKLILSEALTPELQRAIRELIRHDNLSRAEAEQRVLGLDHAAVGAWLLESWHLPEAIVEGVANHHQPLIEPLPLLSVVVHLANCVAHAAGSAPGWEAYAVRVNVEVLDTFGITPEKIEGWVVAVRESCEQLDQFLTKA